MTAVKSDINQSVELRIPPNLKPSSNVVQVFGTVEKFTEGKLNVPVSVVNLPEGFTVSIFPKEIPVVYYTNLRTYDSISATDFKVVCDFNNFNIDSKVLVPTLASYPKSIKNASLEINKLEFVMTKKNDYVICHKDAHILTSECGAPQFFNPGIKPSCAISLST